MRAPPRPRVRAEGEGHGGLPQGQLQGAVPAAGVAHLQRAQPRQAAELVAQRLVDTIPLIFDMISKRQRKAICIHALTMEYFSSSRYPIMCLLRFIHQ